AERSRASDTRIASDRSIAASRWIDWRRAHRPRGRGEVFPHRRTGRSGSYGSGPGTEVAEQLMEGHASKWSRPDMVRSGPFACAVNHRLTPARSLSVRAPSRR